VTTLTLTIQGMTCGHCVGRVTQALRGLDGVHVESVTVGRARVHYDEARVSPARIVGAIEEAGYPAEPAAEPAAGEAPAAHPSLTRLAFSATAHCLTGCAIGEILGMVAGTSLGLSNPATVALSVLLAFVFGYALTLKPLLGAGLSFRAAMGLAFASDTLSIATMEVVDNLVMLGVPGAMDAGLQTPLFWGSLALSLGLAYVVAVPVNRWLLSRGKGHALVHHYHHGPAHSC